MPPQKSCVGGVMGPQPVESKPGVLRQLGLDVGLLPVNGANSSLLPVLGGRAASSLLRVLNFQSDNGEAAALCFS